MALNSQMKTFSAYIKSVKSVSLVTRLVTGVGHYVSGHIFHAID